MDFTREPVVESVITPKEGHRLVVRSSKAAGLEEFFVNILELVSFGDSFFFRSLEKPKSFLLSATDYEIIEINEPSMVFKKARQESSRKIDEESETEPEEEPKEEKTEIDSRPEKKRKESFSARRNRRQVKKNVKDKEDVEKIGTTEVEIKEEKLKKAIIDPSTIPSLLPPPPMLVSDSIKQQEDAQQIDLDGD